MAKFMHIKISLMAEITDADALREAALKNFDDADMTSPDHPDTADWHASEEGQEERRQIATEDKAALNQLGEPAKALTFLDGVPGAKVLHVSARVGELEGTTRREARDTWLDREGITFLPDEMLAAD
ncbi:MAG TPA: hypothetical protein VNV62_24720 [Trebonia sp.]|jgi:hypothetical protein|nr:hypothetical protein [Trebonia sp.]